MNELGTCVCSLIQCDLKHGKNLIWNTIRVHQDNNTKPVLNNDQATHVKSPPISKTTLPASDVDALLSESVWSKPPFCFLWILDRSYELFKSRCLADEICGSMFKELLLSKENGVRDIPTCSFESCIAVEQKNTSFEIQHEGVSKESNSTSLSHYHHHQYQSCRTSRQRLGVNRIDSCNFQLCSQGQLCITINSTVFKDGLGSYVK